MPTPVTITPATQALIDKAFADESAAAEMDDAKNAAGDALNLAQGSYDEAAEASLDAHATATGSAMDALKALATELGIALPEGNGGG